MEKIPLTKQDQNLIESALREFDKPLSHDWHGVVAALRLQSGKIVTGFALEAEVPSLTICAEPIAIGKALADLPDDPITTIVAVRRREDTDHKVIPPCGRCREFITDYAPDADVIIFDMDENALCKVKAFELLPFKYTRSVSGTME